MLDTLRDLVSRKNAIDSEQEWYHGSETYFAGLKDELDEVQTEMKENNSVYLEDELGDVLWDYLNLLQGLENEGKISSTEKVLERAEYKYTQRLEAIELERCDESRMDAWRKIKALQKQLLKKEHDNLYGK